MDAYDVTVTRDGSWWMVEVPALDGLTQARRLSEVTEMARSYIAVTLDVPLSTVTLGAVRVVVGTEDYAAVREHIAELRAEARRAEEAAATLMRETAAALSRAEVPVRDIGEVLGVSYQRASQLASA